jgi:hypothetical protein
VPTASPETLAAWSLPLGGPTAAEGLLGLLAAGPAPDPSPPDPSRRADPTAPVDPHHASPTERRTQPAREEPARPTIAHLDPAGRSGTVRPESPPDDARVRAGGGAAPVGTGGGGDGPATRLPIALPAAGLPETRAPEPEPATLVLAGVGLDRNDDLPGLADKLRRILADEARRHGLDV